MTDNLWQSGNKKYWGYIPKKKTLLSLAGSERKRDHSGANHVRCCILYFDHGESGHKKPVCRHMNAGLCCLALFLPQSAFVTCWERGKGGVKRRKYNHVPVAIPPSSLPLCPCSKSTVAVRDGSPMGNQRQPLFNAMSRDRTASDGGTWGGPLCAVHRPITADETLPTEQLVQQLASCKCNDSNVRTAINTNRHL